VIKIIGASIFTSLKIEKERVVAVEVAVKTKKASVRDKKIKYNPAQLPKLEKGKPYAVNKVIESGAPHEHGRNEQAERECLYLKANRKIVKVFLDEIIYIESAKDYIKIYRQFATPLRAKYSLTALAARLPHNLFVRVHRSFIVSVNRITAFTNYDIEIGKIEIPVGRQYLGQWKRLSETSKVSV